MPLSLLANPWLILGLLLALAGAGASGYLKGHHDAAQAAQVARMSGEIEGARKYQTDAQHQADSATKLEKQNAKIEVRYRTITQTVEKIVDRPVYSNACFDDDGLRAANDALSGTPPDTGGPADGVREPDAATGQDGKSSAGQASGSESAVLPLPSAAQPTR